MEPPNNLLYIYTLSAKNGVPSAEFSKKTLEMKSGYNDKDGHKEMASKTACR